jgi:hypothetical protein
MPGMGVGDAGDSTTHPHFSTVFPFLSTDWRFVFVDALTPRQTGKPPYLHPLSIVPPVVRALPGFVYSFPDSLTVCPLTGRKARPTAVCCLPSAVSIRLFVPRFVDGLSPDGPESPSYGGLPSAVRGLHSFICSPIR